MEFKANKLQEVLFLSMAIPRALRSQAATKRERNQGTVRSIIVDPASVPTPTAT